MKQLILFILLPFATSHAQDYTEYHATIAEVEKMIVKEQYDQALDQLTLLSEQFDFVFVKNHKIGAQLAMYLGRQDEAVAHIKSGIKQGWTLKQIKKTKSLSALQRNESLWKEVTSSYDELHKVYVNRIDQNLKEQVQNMFKRDQWLAIKSLTRFSQGSFDRYMDRKFAPLSEQHMAQLDDMLNTDGYPGEKLVGAELWMMDMLLHHVSMTRAYTEQDTIFYDLTPKLKQAIAKGEMSPYSYAVVYDWYVAVKSGYMESTFGYINKLDRADIGTSDALRAELRMRSVATRLGLEQIEEKTGMDFHLESKVLFNKEMRIAENGDLGNLARVE